jgi:hypothetical protein
MGGGIGENPKKTGEKPKKARIEGGRGGYFLE